MNSIYRIIWNRTLSCYVVASELASGTCKSSRTLNTSVLRTKGFGLSILSCCMLLALSSVGQAAVVTVDGTSYSDSGLKAAAGNDNPVLLVMNGGEATWSSGYLSASGTGAGSVQVQSGSALNLIETTAASLQANTPALVLSGASQLSISNAAVSALGNSIALNVTDSSKMSGNGLKISSEGSGLKVADSDINISNISVIANGQNGYGVHTLGNSNVNIDGGTITTSNTRGYGIFAEGGTVTANNLDITTAGNNARGVLASGTGTTVNLDGGSITTSNARGHAIQATQGAIVDVRNMNLTTTAMRQAQELGAAGLYADAGGWIKADSVNISANSNGISLNNARIDGNNLYLTNTLPAYGPAIWGFNASQLNLTNSDINLKLAGAQGIYVDAGTANLDNVSIHGVNGGVGIVTRYDGTTVAKNLNIAISGVDDTPNLGIRLSNGSGKTSVSLENSTVVINGTTAEALSSATSVPQTLNLKNSMVRSDNIAIKASDASAFDIMADNSVIEGKTLMAGGTAGSGLQVSRVMLTAGNGTRLVGDVAIDRAYTLDSGIVLSNGSSWTGAAAGLHGLTLNNISQWDMTADSDVGNIMLSDSIVAFDHSGSDFKTLTVDGDFTGSNGTLVMNSELNGDDSAHDKLIVNGNTAGKTQVVVNHAGGTGAQTLQGIELISVTGNSTGEFTQKGRIVAGAYDYRLLRGAGNANKNWYLTSDTNVVAPDPTPVTPEVPGTPDEGEAIITPGKPTETVRPGQMIVRPEVGNYIANIAAANTLFNLRLHDRGGETQYVDALTGEKKLTSLWMRNVGGHQQVRDGSSQLKTETNRYVLQLGGDLAGGSSNGTDSLHFGAMAGYGNARSNTDSNVTGYRSQGHTTGYNLGIYGTWYQQPDQQTGAYLDSWLQYSWFNNSVNGDHLQAEQYKSSGFTASIESGYSWKVGEDGLKNSYFIAPSAQFIWMGVKADDFNEANGTRVSSKGDGNVQSRLGVRASLKTPGETGQTVLTPYVEANWINNSKAFGSTFDGVNMRTQGEKNIGELRVGLDSQLNSDLNLWGSVGQQAGSNQYRDTSAAVGIKISF